MPGGKSVWNSLAVPAKVKVLAPPGTSPLSNEGQEKSNSTMKN